jgi:hypothetical protein
MTAEDPLLYFAVGAGILIIAVALVGLLLDWRRRP